MKKLLLGVAIATLLCLTSLPIMADAQLPTAPIDGDMMDDAPDQDLSLMSDPMNANPIVPDMPQDDEEVDVTVDADTDAGEQ